MNEEEKDYLIQKAWNTFHHEHQKILVDYNKKIDTLFIKLIKGAIEEMEKN